MKYILLFFCLFALNRHLYGQYFVPLEDASGINTERFRDSIEAAATRLMSVFPNDSFLTMFKVYDFGYYVLHEHTYGIPEVLRQKIEEVESLSPFYMLFGKQSDRNGIYTKFFVAIKLPADGDFVCLDMLSPTYRVGVSSRHETIANQIYQKNNQLPNTYWDVEKQTIDSLRSFLVGLFDCCDPSPNADSKRPLSCEPCIGGPEKIIFEAHPEQKYGFDNSYGDYVKSIKIGDSDKVNVKTEPIESIRQVYFYPEKIDPDPSEDPTPEIRISISQNKITEEEPVLNINAIKEKMTYIQAKCLTEDGEVFKQGEGEIKTPYRLEVINYPQLNIKLGIRIVNLPGKSCGEVCTIDKDKLQTYLNEVYRSAVVNVEVIILETMECDYDLPNSEGEKDGLFNRFASLTTDEPLIVHNTCKSNDIELNKILYIIGHPSPKKFGMHIDPSGKSINNGEYGFVFPTISKNFMRTIAHELGHLLGIERHKTDSKEVNHVMFAYSHETLPTVLTYFSEWRIITRIP